LAAPCKCWGCAEFPVGAQKLCQPPSPRAALSRGECWTDEEEQGAGSHSSNLEKKELENTPSSEKREAQGETCLLAMLLRQPLLVIPDQYSVHHSFLEQRHKGTT